MKNAVIFIAASHFNQPISLYFQGLARALVQAGHTVHFLADKKQQSTAPSKLYSLYFWPSERPTGFKDALFLRSQILTYKPHIIISSFAAVNWCLLIGAYKRVPIRIAWVHTLSSQIKADTSYSAIWQNFLWLRKRWIYTFATHIFVNSSATKKDFEKSIGISKPIFVRPYLLERESKPVLNFSERVALILCVGRLDLSKGQEVLLRAWALLKSEFPQTVVQFVGAGPQKEMLHKLSIELGLQSCVLFSGQLSLDRVYDLMSRALVHVCPSQAEALGLVNIEALAFGTPVVASATGGILDVIEEDKQGFLFAPGQVDDLALSLKKLLKDQSLWQRCSHAAKARFVEKFSYAESIEHHINEITILVSGL